MSHNFSKRISHQLNRREALALLCAGGFASQRALAADELRFTALDHISLFVGDVDKSVAFYSQVFGNTVLRNQQTVRRYIKLGSGFVAMITAEQGQESHRVDHICPGVTNYDHEGVLAALKGRGLPFRDSALGPFVKDPDGYEIQLWTFDSWAETVKTAKPEAHPIKGEAAFRPTGLDHILMDVTNVEKAAAFYERVFGPVTQRNNNRTWFQVGKSRIGLLATSNGRRPGVNHFCVSVAAFDHETAMKKVEQAGGKREASENPTDVMFRDPDGILVQVVGPPANTNRKA
jgi:catechol 2,3-dioxygenase-like lactoylglutathione lyase family enzyme